MCPAVRECHQGLSRTTAVTDDAVNRTQSLTEEICKSEKGSRGLHNWAWTWGLLQEAQKGRQLRRMEWKYTGKGRGSD